MTRTSVEHRPPAPPASADAGELANVIERLERRLAAIARRARAADDELRRQRACGRRP